MSDIELDIQGFVEQFGREFLHECLQANAEHLDIALYNVTGEALELENRRYGNNNSELARQETDGGWKLARHREVGRSCEWLVKWGPCPGGRAVLSWEWESSGISGGPLNSRITKILSSIQGFVL
jgi:hypothetical protein